ncbi:MAG: T9SS type A sorting domain-containing protein [Bacteroidetes bacterium]|nr:T9SS type A sorting domain-containing protein [Bacteroidota bacterium]
MKKFKIIFSLFILAALCTAQSIPESGSEYCSQKRMKTSLQSLSKKSSAAPPTHSFDVLHYSLELDLYKNFLSPYPHSFSGIETITFRIGSPFSQLSLHAVNSSIVVESVGGAGKSFSHADDILRVFIDTGYKFGDTATVVINYRHLNVEDYAFYASGGFVFTDCEPEGARYWFPCWDMPYDKATTEIQAKVPSSVLLGSNGRLAETTQSGDTLWYHWISRDPMATYLVSLAAKVNYNLDIVYWKKLSNPNDSIPIYFYWNAGESIANLNHIKDIILPMTTYFSELFGEHPFEKNGFASLNNLFAWGGMENQTLTSICPNCWNEGLIAHEFGHQWFGDMITCATWADVWLNEGFATYLEALWDGYTGGYSRYKADILQDANNYLANNPGRPIYNPSWSNDTPPTNILFNTAMTYNKGACVLHMLRYTLGDSLFFHALKSYTADTVNFKYKAATTNDFVDKISEAAGQNMQWFFDQWIFSPNHPLYQYSFSIQRNNNFAWSASFNIKQTQTNTVFFTMPVEVKILFTDGTDSLIRFMNNQNNQTVTLQLTKEPKNFIFDPNNNIVLKKATLLAAEEHLSSTPRQFQLEQNYPNPFNGSTHVRYSIPENSFVSLDVYDMLGRKVKEVISQFHSAGTYTAGIDASSLTSGTYYYTLTAGKFSTTKKFVLVK